MLDPEVSVHCAAVNVEEEKSEVELVEGSIDVEVVVGVTAVVNTMGEPVSEV